MFLCILQLCKFSFLPLLVSFFIPQESETASNLISVGFQISKSSCLSFLTSLFRWVFFSLKNARVYRNGSPRCIFIDGAHPLTAHLTKRSYLPMIPSTMLQEALMGPTNQRCTITNGPTMHKIETRFCCLTVLISSLVFTVCHCSLKLLH